jgi:tRNA1(Val) A37 N6-methylase TrmN6
MNIKIVEKNRLKLDRLNIDCLVDGEANKIGYFSTPPSLAQNIVKETVQYLKKKQKIDVLEPGFGTGSFTSALFKSSLNQKIKCIDGVELSKKLAEGAKKLWSNFPVNISNEDYLKNNMSLKEYDLVIYNPPYSRFHHISKEDKKELKRKFSSDLKLSISGLSGLHVYFILASHSRIKEGGLGVCLISSEFTDTNYGQVLKEYFARNVKLIRVHQFNREASLFDNATTTSTCIWYRKINPSENDTVLFTFGDINNPSKKLVLKSIDLLLNFNWRKGERKQDVGANKIGNYFKISRGIATGANEFFIVNNETIAKYKIPKKFLQPIISSPRTVKSLTFSKKDFEDSKRFLLVIDIETKELSQRYPLLIEYINQGKEKGFDKRHLCKTRKIWYQISRQSSAPILFRYMQRNSSVKERFILNETDAVVTNNFLKLTPKETTDQERIQVIFNLLINNNRLLLDGGRLYAGGLSKLEPSQLSSIEVEFPYESNNFS